MKKNTVTPRNTEGKKVMKMKSYMNELGNRKMVELPITYS